MGSHWRIVAGYEAALWDFLSSHLSSHGCASPQNRALSNASIIFIQRMLTPFSKNKLLRLFQRLEEAENHAESLRQILCKQDEFEPYMVFKNIASDGHLDGRIISQLLLKNGLMVEIEQVMAVVQWYSLKCDQRITYADFMQIVLPAQNPELRRMVTQKQTFAKPLTYEIEYGLCRVLYKEIQIQDELLELKQDLLSQPDFDYLTAFQTIDIYGSGRIQQDLLEHFLSRDASVLMRRLDQNRDSIIDMEDFRLALRIEVTNGPVKPKTQKVRKVEQENRFPNRRAKQSIKQHIDRNKKNSQPKKDEQYDLDYLAQALDIIANLEHENECKREELGYLQYDFLELFAYFDQDRTGKLAPGDVKAALEEFEIYPTQGQLYLWMKRYDTDRDGKWSAKEFLQAFRPQNYQQINKRGLDQEIIDAIKKLIKTEIENEVAIECIRKKLAKRPNFDLKRLFGVITNKQVISEGELRCFLENYGRHLDERHRTLLLKRFDKLEQKFITYSDFLNELYPKQGK